jgi:hypothetical protein
MAEQIPTPADPEAGQREPTADEPMLHVASGEDETEATRQGDLFDAILVRGDLRDQEAERRDRRADRRAPESGDAQACLDRIWSGIDRDSAAADRADLVTLLHAQQGRSPQSAIDQAKDILIARNGCTRHEAFSELRTAAAQNELTIDELAHCLIADQELR